jgi:integrase
MAKRSRPGLVKRGNVWHVRKQIKGYGRLNESTGTSDLAEAERYLSHRLEQIRRVTVYGERPRVTWREAARKFIEEHPHLRSLERTAQAFDGLDPYIGDRYLEQVYDETLKPYVQAQLDAGITPSTINRNLDGVRRVLTLASRKWRHPNGVTWLSAAPLIERLPTSGKYTLSSGEVVQHQKRQPYPLTLEQQTAFFSQLPAHLEAMALFAVNTGLRDDNLTGLLWEWEVQVPELEDSVFVLPGSVMKNGQEFVLVLNRVARRVLEAQRGKHKTHVFTYEGKPVGRMLNTSWKKARKRAGLPQLRAHDLRHTFAHRLKAAGVSEEDRAALLHHRNGSVTRHYSAQDYAHLRECVRKIEQLERGTVLRVVAQKVHNSLRNPQSSTNSAVSA